jgi:hypothetical protein
MHAMAATPWVDGGAARDKREHGLGARCDAPMMGKVVATGQGELRTSGTVDAPAAVACVGRERKCRCLFKKP